jgi:hypothetical protein
MHQPYHAYPLLPPWHAMDYNTRERTLHSLWEPPESDSPAAALWQGVIQRRDAIFADRCQNPPCPPLQKGG